MKQLVFTFLKDLKWKIQSDALEWKGNIKAYLTAPWFGKEHPKTDVNFQSFHKATQHLPDKWINMVELLSFTPW